jgi:hypothetical protein
MWPRVWLLPFVWLGMAAVCRPTSSHVIPGDDQSWEESVREISKLEHVACGRLVSKHPLATAVERIVCVLCLEIPFSFLCFALFDFDCEFWVSFLKMVPQNGGLARAFWIDLTNDYGC